MEVVTNLKRVDLFMATVLNLYRRPFMWGISACPGLLIVFVEAQARRNDSDLGLVLGILGVIAVVVTLSMQTFSLIIGASFMAFRPGTMPGVLGRHVYRTTSEGFSEETDVNSGTSSWRGIHRIRATRWGVLIQLPNASAHFLPRRFFENREQMRSFATEAERFRLAAR